MAGDWIALRVGLHLEPEVIAISGRLGIEADAVVGKLHRLWSWADSVSRDGVTLGVTPQWVDAYLGSQGFAGAMVDVGWLQLAWDNDRVTSIAFPNWRRWHAETSKERVLARERQRRWRERQRNGERNAPVTPPETKKRRLQKRRVVSDSSPKNPCAGAPTGNAGETPPEPQKPQRPDTWLTPYLNAWRDERGAMPTREWAGHMAKFLRPLDMAHGPAAVVPELVGWLRAHAGDAFRFADLSKFAGGFGQWASRRSPATGNLTAAEKTMQNVRLAFGGD